MMNMEGVLRICLNDINKSLLFYIESLFFNYFTDEMTFVKVNMALSFPTMTFVMGVKHILFQLHQAAGRLKTASIL